MAETVADQRYWDDRYRESEHVWSGRPNAALVREAADLPPGRALDLGAGEGGDAIWLAGRGWQVTAADISTVALERAAAHARTEGVADRIDFQRHTLGETFPAGTFDLVSACYLHSEGNLPREQILRTAAAAVAPGGTLLVVGHAGFPHWQGDHHPQVVLPTAREVLAALELPDDAWEVQRCEEHDTPMNRPDGVPDTRPDCTVKARRLDA
ncbi:Methyltransferase domain-containing protein [Streptomyces sp. DvalAA-14]|uniref:SAM-dependent methyltransferase n=1 Tax=unclassified Streptomyces TaxID=2593676 RepID=UPI00081B6C89|nr:MULTISPECIES: class I SAM-dependent methyltransferase [unclassified Streptomyces]MYS23082.1 methyltransferase domain-containing protein [Streptomyces sp. SID4948]SCE27046.1 Methyltransferase domain-containing protein [Streptomyces sp. DvalAA-14]